MLGEFNTIIQPQPQIDSIPLPTVYYKEKVIWEYKHIIRNLEQEEILAESELNMLGGEGWELAEIVTNLPLVHFYFKRLVK